MKTKTLRLALASILLLTLALAPAALASEPWIHVKIEGDHSENVAINLPLSLVRAAAAMIPAEIETDAQIQIDDLDLNWNQLRTFWSEVKDAPEATFITIENDNETIRVRKEGDFLTVRSDEDRGGAEIDVQFPLRVVDALLSAPDGRLDFAAALDALASYGPGHLVSIRDGDQTVKVWVDYFEEGV